MGISDGTREVNALDIAERAEFLTTPYNGTEHFVLELVRSLAVIVDRQAREISRLQNEHDALRRHLGVN